VLPRSPRQARSRASRERILDAAEAVVAAKGFEAAAVAEVVARAGSSVGVFYARFRDKRGLLHALYDRFHRDAQARLDAALDPERWAAAPTAPLVQALVRTLVDLHRERRGLARAFAVEAARDPELQARRDRLSQHLAGRLAERLRGRPGEIAHHHPERASAFGMAVVASTIEGAVLFDRLRTGALAPSDGDLAAELARLLLAYLGVPKDEARPATPSAGR
jgi:AcrR family transcriptional regulator